ncbi:Arm DNA-binding domain-containing protein [Pseudomonas sichuanensis]|uniref:Arm DNA-binding domain-containing protein n=1 Tax=Pseudomonas TaxID=286 RepID=UPI003812CFDC
MEIRGDSLRIRFTWNGERRGETLAHPPTAQGIRAVSRVRDQVVNLIRHDDAAGNYLANSMDLGRCEA